MTTTKATRDVIDLKVRPISAINGDGLKVEGDCGADFAIDGVPIGINTPCNANFVDITITGGLDMDGNNIDMDGGAIQNASANSGPTGEVWITESLSDARDADTLAAANNFSEALVQQAIPVGVVIPFAGDTAPSGWLLCAGQEVNRVTFARLFDVIGITYGPGDGSITFNVPDLRGRVPAGVDTMGGSAAGRLTGAVYQNLGGAGGSEATDYQFAYSGNDSFSGSTAPASASGPADFGGGFGAATSGHNHSFSVNYAWSGLTDLAEIRRVQPTIALNYIIRA